MNSQSKGLHPARACIGLPLLAGALLLASGVALAGNVPAKPTVAPAPAKEVVPTMSYTVSSAPIKPLALEKPPLPDLAGYTPEAVEAKAVPLRKKHGEVHLRTMLQQNVLKNFTGGDNKLANWVGRQHDIPQAIFVENGYVNLRDLTKSVPAKFFREVSPGVYLARLPIIVAHNAVFEIDKSTQELRMSQEGGSFLINDGKIFVTNTKLTGWNEKNNGPSLFRDPKEFRPFFLSWGGTETYMVNTKVASLGYNNSKSYGISISQYTPSMKEQMGRSMPTGWIIGSEFSDMWYGFYCYETQDFVVKSNTYHDNITYGIDPHDRSERLIIADNDVYGTQHKHGIIISREVNDSWIFNNRSHNNNLSGLVIDRNSVNNLVADNLFYQNSSDGITLYESADNLIWGNKVIGNKRHGIRIRNSVNIRLYNNLALTNHLVGIYGHIKDLSNTNRDMKLDPFDTKVSLIVVGGALNGNGTSPLAIDSPLSLELYDVAMLAPVKANGIAFSGILGDRETEILDMLVRQKKAVLIDPVESQAELHN